MPSTTVEIKGKDNTKKAFSSVGKSMERLKTSMGGLRGAVACLIGGAGLGALAMELRQTADQVGKVSARLGIGSADLQKFQFAAMKSGMDVRQFNIALQRFTRRTSEAFIGTGEAKDAIAEFGIQLSDSNNKLRSNSDILLEVATIMASDLIPQADKVRLAFKLFDSEGVKMLNMLQQGPEAIKGMGRELEALGGVINDETIVASEKLGDRWDMIMAKVKNLFAPAITTANNLLGVFTEKAEMAGMTSKQLEKHIISIRNSLIHKKKALDKNNRGLKKLFLASRMSAKQIEQEKNNIDDSIDSMNEQIAALKQAKVWRDKQIKASLAQIKAIKRENIARNEVNNEILHQNDILASQISMYSQGMTKIEESKNKLASATAANIIQIKKEKEEKIKAEKAIQAAKVAGIKGPLTTMEGMASAVKDEGVELFRFWQAAALANIYMSTAEAITKAYAQLGPLFGSIAAGAMTVLGAAQARKVANLSPPKKEAGGDVLAGQTYLVGERGPELFTPGQMGSIAPNRNSNQEITVNIYDGTGRRISEYASAIRVEIENRANRHNQFAALAA